MAEMRIIAARMLWNFDFELVDKEGDGQVMVGMGVGLGVVDRFFFMRRRWRVRWRHGFDLRMRRLVGVLF